MVGDVRTAKNDDTSAFLCHANHRECRFAHPQEAHFGKVIEIVLVDDGVIRFVFVQRLRPFLFRLCQHGIEERNFISPLADVTRSI